MVKQKQRSINMMKNRQKDYNDKQKKGQLLREKLAARSKGLKTLCLTMIVKNESKNMSRLLESLHKILDFICITDTGSTDNTIEVIEECGKKYNIPTKVYQDPFVNFSHNRTRSLKNAEEAFPQTDYFLLSDADFVWIIDESFNKALLIDEMYLVVQTDHKSKYWNSRVLKRGIKWICEGVTHEIWMKAEDDDYTGRFYRSNLNGLIIDDRGDGGCKSDKFERDKRLLREELDKEDIKPGLKSRYAFYYAQTLRDSRQYLDSITWYNKRISYGGNFDEEIFYSKYQIGILYQRLALECFSAIKLLTKEKLDDNELLFIEKYIEFTPDELYKKSNNYYLEAITNLYKAWEFRKTRVESLYELICIYNDLRMYEQAYNICHIAIKINYPDEDILFVEHSSYSLVKGKNNRTGFMIEIQLAVCCFYLEKKEEGRELCQFLLTEKDCQENELNTIKSICRHYV